MRRRWISLPSIAILGLGLACSDGGGPAGPDGGDGSGTVGPAGGTVSLQTQAGVTVPAGALTGDVTITITAVSTPASLAGAGAIGQAYRFTPEGQQFQLPVEVFVFVPNAELTGVDPADLTLLATTATGFEQLTGITVDIGSSGITVRGHVSHFTVISAAVEEDEPPPNRAPVASAGADQNGSVGVQVTLSGAGSSDPDGDPLTFEWRTVASPGSVPVSLAGAATSQATFTPTTPGEYEFELTVSDAELADRDTVRVTVGAANVAPTVDAGADHSVTVGAAATVTASAEDPDGDPLTFAWTVTSRPTGSTASLSATNTASVSITPDVAGEYVLQVTVSDGRGGQAADTVRVTATAAGANRAPTANAGFDLEGTETITMTLDGTGSSDPDGDPLTFSWTVVSRPEGSTAEIGSASSAVASFTPDLEGTYVVQLAVSDGEFTATDTATLTVGPFNHPPVGTLTIDGSAQLLVGTSVTATADFTDADGDPLEFTWTLDTPDGSSATPTVSLDGTQATFTPDVPGEYVIAVSVSDGQKSGGAQFIVTAFPQVAGTYSTQFTLTFVSQICQDFIGPPGQSIIVDMGVTQPTPATAVLGVSALIENVQNDPTASLSPGGLAIYTGPIVLETGLEPPDPETITANGGITLPFQFANGAGSPATGFTNGVFDFTATVFTFTCTVQGTLQSPPN